MSLDSLCKALPDYAKDIRVNLSVLMNETLLSEQQKWGCFIASAYAVGSAEAIKALEDGCPLSETALDAAKGAAGVMAMNNVYYRTISLVKSHEYNSLAANLHMSLIANPGVDTNDFELWCMAVSAINGCGICLDSHEEELRKRGVSGPVIQSAFRIAAVVNAASRILIAEAGKQA
ncbi:MAG: carboxymuconolactone decarboxylase family protein [Caulobacteraceae bacterium]